MTWLSDLLWGSPMTIPAADPPSAGSRSQVPSTETEEDDDGTTNQDVRPAAPRSGAPWLDLARKEDGTIEGVGSRNNPRIVAYFRDAGHPEIHDDETAWCAAFVGAMLQRAGYTPSGSLLAKSYLKWGKPCTPQMGAIMVFNRAGDPRLGHVGFYVGEDHDSYFVLGGNQWNKATGRSEIVNVGRQPKSRLAGARWPTTLASSKTMQGLGVSGTGVTLQQTASAIPTDTAQSLTDAGNQLTALSHVKWWLALVGTVLILAGLAYAVYGRWDIMKRQGV